MRAILLSVWAVCTVGLLSAQSNIDTYIKEAQGYLAQKDYKQAQLSLQDAINEINNMLAAQVAEAFPAEINGLKVVGESEGSVAGMAFMGGGFTISRTYQHPAKAENEAEVVMVGNSPMMASMSMILSNPAMMGQEYKSVRVGTRRAILKSEPEDYYGDDGSEKKIRATELQIPLTSTLITMNLKGFANEAEELSFASKLDIEKIRTLLGE